MSYRPLMVNLLMLLDKYGPMTRPEIAKLTQVKRTTLYDNLQELEEYGEVAREPVWKGKKGRPKVVWKVNLD